MESVIDKLLVFMADELESQGCLCGNLSFNFGEEKEDATALFAKHPDLVDRLIPALKVCASREYICNDNIGYNFVMLSDEGYARALSVKLHKPQPAEQPGIVIHELHASGPMQVGHGNTMRIEAFHAAAENRIDSSDASDKDKATAKSLLARALEHPLVCAAVGGLVGAAAPGLYGKGKP